MKQTSDLRDGEAVLDAPQAQDAFVQFIGTIRTPFTTRDLCPRQGKLEGPDCRLELLPEWSAALKGITAFEYLDVLYWLHMSRRDLVLQSPKSDGHTIGLCCTNRLKGVLPLSPDGFSLRVQ